MSIDISRHKYRNALKCNQTISEIQFWKILQNCLLKHYPGLANHVMKQAPIKHDKGFYILDFYIGSLRLAFEIDGGYHWQSKQLNKDLKRDTFLTNERRIIVHHIPNSALETGRGRNELHNNLLRWIEKRIIVRRKLERILQGPWLLEKELGLKHSRPHKL